MTSRQPPLVFFFPQRKRNKAVLLLLRVQGLTSAAERFPGWGHPALWCPSARPTPWSWRCPEAREGDGRVREGRGEEEVGGEGDERRAQRWQKWLHVCQKEGTGEKLFKQGKGTKRRGKGGWEQRGQEWCAWGKGSTLLIRLTKQKTWRKETHKHLTQLWREHEFQTIHGWGQMHRQENAKEFKEFNTTVKSGFFTSLQLNFHVPQKGNCATEIMLVRGVRVQ